MIRNLPVGPFLDPNTNDNKLSFRIINFDYSDVKQFILAHAIGTQKFDEYFEKLSGNEPWRITNFGYGATAFVILFSGSLWDSRRKRFDL